VQSLSTVPAPTADELAARYAESPVATGAVCARHILVETEAEADAVVQELADGADFAELAAQRSIEPAAADTGGALAGSDGNACLPVSTYQSQFDPGFTAGVLVAEAGVPSAPVESQFGWHVILIRPYDEVADDLAALVGTAPGDAALAGALVTADVTVDPRYGQWDRTTASVISLR
jgi:parvulin-like peptidyl-prolyl isomerase